MNMDKRTLRVGMASVALLAGVLCSGGCQKEEKAAPEAAIEKAAEQPAAAPAEDPAAQKPKDHPAH